MLHSVVLMCMGRSTLAVMPGLTAADVVGALTRRMAAATMRARIPSLASLLCKTLCFSSMRRTSRLWLEMLALSQRRLSGLAFLVQH